MKEHRGHCALSRRGFGLSLPHKNLQTRVRLFITVGSGLLKLHQLNSERLRLLVGLCAFLVPVSGLVALMVVAYWYGFYDYSVGKDPLDAVLGALFFVIALAVAAVRQKGDGELEQQAARFKNDGIKWIDMYAGMDPVPNGPLFLRKTSSPESVEVCKGASVLGDHTSYHKNVDELFLLIVRAIAKYSGTKLQLTELTPRDEAVVAFAGPFRQIRIASRKVEEFLLVLALVAVLARPELIAAVGSYVGESINAACRWVGSRCVLEGTSGAQRLGAYAFGLCAAADGDRSLCWRVEPFFNERGLQPIGGNLVLGLGVFDLLQPPDSGHCAVVGVSIVLPGPGSLRRCADVDGSRSRPPEIATLSSGPADGSTRRSCFDVG